MDISIHPPREGRDRISDAGSLVHDISIHPPRGGRDRLCPTSGEDYLRFQSTLPVGGGTYRNKGGMRMFDISIHPPRGGRD